MSKSLVPINDQRKELFDKEIKTLLNMHLENIVSLLDVID